MPIRTVIGVFLLLLTAGCATGNTVGDQGPRRNRNVITLEELAGVSPDYSAYDVVRRLRANWLSGRGGTSPRVLVNGMALGNVGVLRNYRAEDLSEIRYIFPSDATTRYGTGYQGGAIEVVLK